MTVTYTAEVASCKKFGCFLKLLARWRGSIYKLIWMDLILFLFLYYCINLIYLYLLEDNSKRTFESIVYYCASYTSLIPLSFVLGFYVSLVMTRWWEQYTTIPWPDSIAVFVSAHMHGTNEASRVMRRTVMRYVCLCLTIVFTMISPCVKKRFPKLKHLVEAGLLLENEKKIIETMDDSFPKYPKHWMSIVWAASIITRARREGHIRDDFAVKTIIDELNRFRGLCGTLMYYDFISIPLVYTQVVTIAVYSFFVCSLLAHQWTDSKRNTHEALDFYSPVFITLQFFFYMGWLKVAETLINPFGEDDDDFEVNWMIDRNLQVSYLIVDEMHHEHPELIKDQYWDEVYPNELPYETDAKREQPPEPSTAKYDLEVPPKHVASKVLHNSAIMNGKPGISIYSTLNERSQRFNEAFQRFFNFSRNDVIGVRTDEENSFQSISEIENIENIISYTPLDHDKTYVEKENILSKSILETVDEESEEIYAELEEQDMLNIEDDDEQTEEEEALSEDDYDSDPFERLRIERQQQRLQRMNDYLERNFGPNFRILSDHLESPAPKAKYNYGLSSIENSSKPNIQSIGLVSIEESENGVILNEQQVDEKAILATTISMDNIKPISKHEVEMEQTLENNIIQLDQKQESENLVEEKDLSNITLTSFSQIPLKRFSKILEIHDIDNTSGVIGFHTPLSKQESGTEHYSFPTTQVQTSSNILLTESEISEHTQTIETGLEAKPTDIATNTLGSNESVPMRTSKANSPFGSARSVSTQSSIVDEWEILSAVNSTITGELIVNIVESKEESNK